MLSLTAFAGVVLYPLAATNRLGAVIAAVGGASLLLFAAALAWRLPALETLDVAPMPAPTTPAAPPAKPTSPTPPRRRRGH